jgi:hypothetical protein
MNTTKLRVRIGAVPLLGQQPVINSAETFFRVAAGTDLADEQNVRMLVGAMASILFDNVPGIADTLITGIV